MPTFSASGKLPRHKKHECNLVKSGGKNEESSRRLVTTIRHSRRASTTLKDVLVLRFALVELKVLQHNQ